jgi:hypothetical protein
MTLFVRENFISAAGLSLDWKIECDALSGEDWATIGLACARGLPKFGPVVSVPSGGRKLASVMLRYSSFEGCEPTLVVDDVWTTGKSMMGIASGLSSPWIGLVVFSRGNNRPGNVYALMQLSL